MKEVEFKELIGLHELTGVDTGKTHLPDEYSDSETISFVLDGKTYTAVEDPNDGYRSSLKSLFVSEEVIRNTFPPCLVLGRLRNGNDREGWDILDFIDIHTAKVVLSIGTDNTDDYYPFFVGEFSPENMYINATVEEKA